MTIYDLTVKGISGEGVPLSKFKGKVLLIVNVASRCGFTEQYAGLQSLYEKFHSRGFEVLAFPCNQFGAQEPGSESEIQAFCDQHYGVTFPLFSKIEVNGMAADPLFQLLKSSAKGILGTEAIKWNFTKFLIDASGKVIRRYAPKDTPKSLEEAIEALVSNR